MQNQEDPRARVDRDVAMQDVRFRAAIESTPDALTIISTVPDHHGTVVNFRFEYVNDAYCDLVGLGRGELLGRLLGDVFPGFVDSERFAVYRQVLLSGEPFRTEDTTPVDIARSPARVGRVLDVSVALMGEELVVTARDVTERRGFEAQLRFAVGSMLDGFSIFSPVRDARGEIVDFRFDYANDSACELVGSDRAQILGRVVSGLFPGYLGSERFALHRRVLDSGEPASSVDVSGAPAWLGSMLAGRVINTTIVAVAGKIVVSSRDVTDRWQAEKEIVQRAELLDLAHEAVIVREPSESRVRFWNRQAAAVYGYTVAEAIGQVSHELLATVFPDSRQAVDEALAHDGQWRGELRHRRKDGSELLVSSRQALQRDADGRC